MAELKIDANNIDTIVTSIKNANKNINASTSSVHNPSKSSGIMISAYVDRIQKIGQLLDLYKQLLEKDAVDIVASKNKIVEMDQKIKQLYKDGGGKQ